MNWGGVWSEASQALISFGLGVPPLNPLTLSEARVNGFSVISEFASSGQWADRSWGFSVVAGWEFLAVTLRPKFIIGNTICVWESWIEPRADKGKKDSGYFMSSLMISLILNPI
jgi:hypothetical protein